MGRDCTVCRHEALPEIEAQIRAKTRYQDIADRFGLHRKAIGRHKRNHMDGPMVRIEKDEIEPLGASGTVKQRLEALLRKAELILWKAEHGKSIDVQIRALAECRKQVELLAKVIGDIRDDTTVQILQVIMPHERD